MRKGMFERHRKTCISPRPLQIYPFSGFSNELLRLSELFSVNLDTYSCHFEILIGVVILGKLCIEIKFSIVQKEFLLY
jgi:hypothetical protein